jgi:putative copper export protein
MLDRAPVMIPWHTLSLLFHLIAVALWLGAIVFFLVVSGPAVHELDAALAIKTMNRSRIGLEMISWSAIALMLLTGTINLILRLQANPPAAGEFYTVLLATKLFIFGAMAMHHGLQVFKYGPRIAAQTAQLRPYIDQWPEALLADWRRWFLLLKINAALGPVAVLLGLALNQS